MGAWGAGLYADDFALDLRPAVAALCRLPYGGDEIVGLLVDMEPAASDPGDEDHTTFWLVVADQLQRRGIDSRARSRALAVIDDGSDLRRLEAQEMGPADLRRRRRALERLRDQLAGPPPARPRRTLRAPQPLLLAAGEMYRYPIDGAGRAVNPYFPAGLRDQFEPFAWGAFGVVDAGHVFEYLAWYRVDVSTRASLAEPDLALASRLVATADVSYTTVGTLTKAHAAAMRLELVGTGDVRAAAPPRRDEVVRRTAEDISIANLLDVRPHDGDLPLLGVDRRERRAGRRPFGGRR